MFKNITLPPSKNIAMQTTAKQRPDDRYIPEEYKDIAKGMEHQFAEYLISQLNNTIDKAESENQDSAAQFYDGLQTTERAKVLTENKQHGLGIQPIILNQLYPTRLRNEANYQNYLKMKEESNLHRNKIHLAKKQDEHNISMRDEKIQIASPSLKEN